MKRFFLLNIFLLVSQLLISQDGIRLYTDAQKFLNQGQYKQAAEKLSQATGYFQDNYIISKAVEVNILAGKTNEARQLANRIKGTQKFLEIAKIYANTGQYNSAYDYLVKYLSSKDKLPEYQLKRDTLLVALHDTQWWQKLWKKTWYDSIFVTLDRVEVEARYGDASAAIDQLEIIAREQPHNKRIYVLLSQSYERLGAIDAAIAQLNKALAIEHNDYNLLLKLGNLYAKKQDYALAAQVLEKAYRLRPYEIELLPQIAEWQSKSSNLDKALNALQQYLQYDDNPQVRYQLAETYYLKGDYLQTIRTVNKLLDTDKNNYKYLTLRGKSYLRTNNYQNAYYDMTMSLDLYPEQPELYRLIGQSAYFIGHKEEACLYWQRSYQIFHDKEALKMLNQTCKKH